MVVGTDDQLIPFQLDRSGLRGRVLRLGPTVDHILSRHGHNERLSALLGEFVVLGASLAGGLKYEGRFSLQTRSDGAVRLIVADVTNEGGIRAYASADEERLDQIDEADFETMVGKGYLAVTVDQSARGGETYQGIVELQGSSLADCMLAYFRQSEQVRTGIAIAVGRDANGHWRGGGIVIQKLPDENGSALADREEDWHRTMLLMSTVAESELIDPFLDPRRLLWRLFSEEEVRVYEPKTLKAECRCSPERIGAMLESFSADDLDDMADEDGKITITCQFCKQVYRSHREDPTNVAPLTETHN
ncbi:MAG: Hsp33 family molecular chaperone HslO [Geminicoccaceae bacterium]